MLSEISRGVSGEGEEREDSDSDGDREDAEERGEDETQGITEVLRMAELASAHAAAVTLQPPSPATAARQLDRLRGAEASAGEEATAEISLDDELDLISEQNLFPGENLA